MPELFKLFSYQGVILQTGMVFRFTDGPGYEVKLSQENVAFNAIGAIDSYLEYPESFELDTMRNFSLSLTEDQIATLKKIFDRSGISFDPKTSEWIYCNYSTSSVDFTCPGDDPFRFNANKIPPFALQERMFIGVFSGAPYYDVSFKNNRRTLLLKSSGEQITVDGRAMLHFNPATSRLEDITERLGSIDI